MAHIKVESPQINRTRVWVDGVEVQGLTNIKTSVGLGEVPTVELSLIGVDGLELDAQADVKVEIVLVHEGYEIVSWKSDTGVTHYRAVSLDKKETQ